MRVRWAAGMAGIALVAAGCGMGEDSSASAGGGGHVVYAEQFAPATGWALESNDAHPLTRSGCLETLVKYNHDGELEPMLATEWEQVEPTTWEFTLRDDVKFQNGTAMDADTVAGALTHVLDAATPARAFNPDVISAVEAADGAVRVSTPKPDPLVPLRVASPTAGILAPDAYEGKAINILGTCTGPFTVTEEVPQQSLTLERNEDYWGGEVNIETAEIRFIVDGATRATQLQSGEVQIAKSVPVSSLATLESDSNLEIQQRELTRTTSLLLNNSQPPFDDPIVRQAIQHVIDPAAIVDAVYEGSGESAVGPFGPATEWAPEGAETPAHDLDEARALLDQAGVDPESLSIELIAYNDRPEFGDVAAVLQDQMGQIGIEVDIRPGDYAALEPDLLSGNFDAALLSRGYLVDVADPGGYLLSDWTCDGGYNIAHYCDPETDQMIEDAVGIEDAEDRAAAYQEIADVLQGDAASAFLLHENAVWGTKSGLEGFEPHPLDLYVFTADLALGD